MWECESCGYRFGKIQDTVSQKKAEEDMQYQEYLLNEQLVIDRIRKELENKLGQDIEQYLGGNPNLDVIGDIKARKQVESLIQRIRLLNERKARTQQKSA
jgi:hypothetical protein